MDCTPSCRFSSHASIIHSAITREDLPTLQAAMKRVCSNPSNLTDSLGRHAIHVAASCGRVDILEWLVREGKVDVEMRDHESRWTPLHRSLFYGKLTCAVKLLQYGADLYSLDKDDLTPLDSVLLDSPFKLATSVEARVVTNYETNLDDELSLRVNDVITNIQMAGQMYWTGSLKGVRGFFPKDCVKLIKQEYKTDLYTWGVNTNFTLGHQDESLRQNPEIVETLSVEKTLNICQVVMCKFHSVFLSEDGKVLTCGHGRGGRLGHQGEHTQLAPKLVEGLKDHKCVGIAAAQDHTAVVTDSGLVFTFGLNDMHQLGHTPALTQSFVPRMIQIKLWRGKHMTGVATGQYHTAMYTHNELFTCGLNIGQLGHLHVKGEKFITTPRQVTALHHKDVSIVMVTCSNAATVCATTKGDIFVLSQFTCQKIVNRFPELVHVVVSGGEIELNINQEPIKAHDKITVTLLNARGLVYQWKESYGGIRRCKWSHRKELVVCDIAVGKQLYLITDCGEMFSCTRAGGDHPAVKRVRSSSSVSPGLSFGEGQKDLVNYDVKRCPMVHRGTKVFTDRISKGFAVLQVNPSTGLQRFPKVSDSMMCEDFTQLLDETIVEDDIHDVDLVVKGHVIPAHKFILASRSEIFRQLLIGNKNKPCGLVNGCTRTLELDHVDDYNVLENYLQDLYSGFHVDDNVLFGNKPATKSSSRERQKVENHVNGVENNPIGSLLTSFESFSFTDIDDLSVNRPIRNKKQTKKTEKFTSKNGLPTDQKKKMTKDSRNVFKDLKFKRTNCPELHDITIESEDDVQFVCHKCVLVARLDYFRSMLACGWLEASEDMRVLHMPIHSSVLTIVLDYLYTGEAKTVQGHGDVVFVGNVLVVADQLLICRLREICELAMVKLISQKNAVELLEFSCVYNASQLSASCLEFICINLGCFLEAGYLSLLSQETLEMLSDRYRDMIYNMAWRMITPQHDHLFALSPDPFSTPTKKRRTSSRKRSVRSDSEGEGENESTVMQAELQESENRGRKASESNLDSVFEGNVTENGKEESTTDEIPEVAVSIEQQLEEKEADAGAWYRKKAGKDEQIKSPRTQSRLQSRQIKTLGKLTVTKPKEIPKPRDEEKLSSRCAWGNSATSPPSNDLRAIMEQEQLSGATKIKSQTSSNKIEAKGKLSQKQKKKAKLAQHNEANVSPEQQNQQKQQPVETKEEKTNINPWGQLDKKPSCVRSLRELIEQEEKSQSRTRPKPAVNSSPSTAKSNDKGLVTKDKPNIKTRLSWGLPRVGQNEPCQENEAESVSPKSAWQAHASASSPPPSPISFADVIHLQEYETTSLDRAKRKPLNLIQLEDRAIQELLEHYGGRDNACETITVERVSSAAATPVWNTARSASAMSS